VLLVISSILLCVGLVIAGTVVIKRNKASDYSSSPPTNDYSNSSPIFGAGKEKKLEDMEMEV